MLISIFIEGKKYIVEDSNNILEICLSYGFDIPYFCWHPALGSVGACRQCAVKCIYNNKKTGNVNSTIVMSCMTPVVEGMHISIFDDVVQKFRRNILELLMINHPHDCPICEEGGNCHLQDMTVMVGHTYRRYRFTKRTHLNQYLGPFIAHEMNRCITCYRCIRYYKDYAGGDDLGVFGIHDNIYFGRVSDGILQNEFSGNLVEICPTGVFTDKTSSKNYVRKWDAIFSPSICHQCGVGCNIILGERYGKLCRVENRYNSSINGYFLCDRGRFGCGYINLDNRPKMPLRKDGINQVKINQVESIQYAIDLLKRSCKVIGIGSSRASIESNFALRKLVGADNFYTGINRFEQERLSLILNILSNSGIYIPTVLEMEDYDLIFILGEDLTQTSARIALSVRQAVKGALSKKAKSQGIFDWQSMAVMNIAQDIKFPLLITSIDKTKLDDLAMCTYYDSVQNQARFAFAIAHALDKTAPVVHDLDSKLNDKLDIMVQALSKAHKPLIISGSNSGSKSLIEASANIAFALKKRGSSVGLTFMVNDVNSMGLTMIENKSLDDALDALCDSNSSATSVIILENDLYRQANSIKINQALSNINYLIVLDHQYNLIQDQADLVLPVTSFAESDGTVVNYEGRAQRFFRLYSPKLYDNDAVVLEAWRWLYLIHNKSTDCVDKNNLRIDSVIDFIVQDFPNLIGIKYAAPDASFRVHGQKLAQAPHRYSGRTAMRTNYNIHEASVFPNNETMFTPSMEGSHTTISSHKQVAFAWAPGWNSPQSWNKFQDRVGKRLHSGDPGIRLISTQLQDSYSSFYKKLRWFTDIPKPFVISKNINKWLIAPYWHLFGSDDTSQRSECIKECMLSSYVMLNESDAFHLKIQNDMLLKFTCANQVLCLPVRISIDLPMRHIGLPIGFPNIPVFFISMFADNIEKVLF